MDFSPYKRAGTTAVALAAAMLVAVAFLYHASLLRAAGHIVVLQYHHFGSQTPPSTSIALDKFDAQIEYLEKNGFSVWPLEKAISYLRQGRSLPDKCVAITIDDAYLSVYTEAFPRLRRRNWPFSVFVATRAIDRGGSAFMSWDQMREMLPHNATFEIHSHSHPYLIRKKAGENEGQWERRVVSEIRTSQKRLLQELGVKSVLFAYPYGEYNLELKKTVRDLGLIGIAQQSGAIWSGSDFAALPRYPLSGAFADLADFKVKVNSLPLPVISARPEDPILSEGAYTPTLRLKLAPAEYNVHSLACFASGQGRIKVKWIDRQNPEFEVVPKRPLPVGRNRYNCTASHNKQNRYYWYSHQWIRPAN
ncbi:MAG: polysaccharide deacetylase family protein [Proteobacteria bacterium]|nr:polysaccharide deacetylase family protein [Pseudomonadota bacterium]